MAMANQLLCHLKVQRASSISSSIVLFISLQIGLITPDVAPPPYGTLHLNRRAVLLYG